MQLEIVELLLVGRTKAPSTFKKKSCMTSRISLLEFGYFASLIPRICELIYNDSRDLDPSQLPVWSGSWTAAM